jgi:putative phage-type endonuclease
MESTEARQSFLAERKAGIGGSDTPVILGLSSWKTPLQLWLEKTGRAGEIPDNPIFRRGRKLEPVVASEYEEETGRRLLTGRRPMSSHPDHPFMIGHVDYVIDDAVRGTGVLECKAANIFKIRDWDEEAPLVAQVQLQHYLAVTGCSWGSIAGLLGGIEFKYQDIDLDHAFIEKLIEKERAFWALVQSDTPPEPQAADNSVIGKIFDAIDGTVVALPQDAIAWDIQRLSAKSEIDRLEELKDEAEAKIKFAMGSATQAVLPDGTRYTFNVIHRKGFVVAPTSFRTLRRSKS